MLMTSPRDASSTSRVDYGAITWPSHMVLPFPSRSHGGRLGRHWRGRGRTLACRLPRACIRSAGSGQGRSTTSANRPHAASPVGDAGWRVRASDALPGPAHSRARPVGASRSRGLRLRGVGDCRQGTVLQRKALEAVAITLYRRKAGCSPTANFGRMPVGYRASTGNNARLVATGRRARGGRDTDPPTITPSVPVAGSLGGNPDSVDWMGWDWHGWVPVDEACGQRTVSGSTGSGPPGAAKGYCSTSAKARTSQPGFGRTWPRANPRSPPGRSFLHGAGRLVGRAAGGCAGQPA